MTRRDLRLFAALCAIGLSGLAHAVPVYIDYGIAATGQSARAGFEFADATTLRISLEETTPAGASTLTGGEAILTSLGFALPRVQVAGGSGPALWGFSTLTLPQALQAQSFELGAAAAAQSAIAAEQDAIVTARMARAQAQRNAAAQLLGNNPDPQQKADAADLIHAAERDEAVAATARTARDAALAQAAGLQAQADDFALRAATAPALQWLGVLPGPLTPFAPGGAGDGLSGGLLADGDASGGIPVFANASFSLSLSDALSGLEQELFLASLPSLSAVGYGAGGLLGGVHSTGSLGVPEPATLSLFAVAALAAGLLRRKKRGEAVEETAPPLRSRG